MAKKSTTPKKKKVLTIKDMEESLWKSCNKLRGSVEPAEYKHVVLSLVFLKYASDKFFFRRNQLIEQGLSDYIDQVEFYTSENVFYIPESARWDFIMQQAKQDTIFMTIDNALSAIEKSNKQLEGALPFNYYANLGLDKTKFASLLDCINNLQPMADQENDFMGRVYEFFLRKFAIAEGKGKGEFYTPKSVVNLLAELIEPYDGKIYDPCCGSGGMFVQSMKFVEAHHGNQRNVSVYGQELTKTTFKLARMNMAIRGISADIRLGDTFHSDQHPDLKADYIMANPPFNLKDWREENQLNSDGRWMGYDVPPTSNANYGWILHMLSKLSDNGIAGFILSNGALSADGTELAIRQKLLERGKVEAVIILPAKLFYSTDISVSIWIINNNKKSRIVKKNGKEIHYRDREKEVLFMDLRTLGTPFEKNYVELSEELRAQVAKDFHHWQTIGLEDKIEYCKTVFVNNLENFSLIPSKYIEFNYRKEQIDFDKEIRSIYAELNELQKERLVLDDQLQEMFKEFGITL